MRQPAVERGAQARGLVDRGRGRRVVPRRQRALHGHVVGLDRHGMVDEHRPGLRVQQRERAREHVVLELRIAGATERPSEREVAVERARGRQALGDLAHRHQRDGGDPRRFDDP